MVKPIKDSEMPVPSETMAEANNHFVHFFYSFASGKIRTFDGNIRMTLQPSGGHTREGDVNGTERFLLHIPYAGDHLEWHILFDSQEPESPPQFIFNRASEPRYERSDTNFLEMCEIDELEEHLPHLANWDSTNHNALVDVVEELLAVFRKHQLMKVNDIDAINVRFKVNHLLESQTVSESDIELLAKGDEVTMLVRLAVDMTKVPELLLPPSDRGQQEILACVQIHLTSSRMTSKILLSPRMQLIVGSDKDFKIPSIQSRHTLPEYVDLARKQLDDRIESVVGGVNNRKRFLTALVNLMGRALVETDTKNFTKTTFLLEWNNFSFLVHCCLPPSFPKEQPIYLFQSVYHFTKQRPFASKCSDYPYSPNWTNFEMADRAKVFILDYVKKFQADSIRAT